MSWLVVRVRSDVGVEHGIKETMHMLNLTRVNHATIIPQRPQYAGMLQKAKDYLTWGEVSAEMTQKLISERGRMVGDKAVTDEIVSEGTEYSDIASFSEAIASGDAVMKDLTDLKRIFRLQPPTGAKGWGGIKRSFVVGGALGARGDAIEALVERMI
ncbi:MAG TPA: 50S ribosomal protein L30 [Candidatus Poseidoniales archaeon]|jgi:large subunit ribosomal protein L30|nr:MAG: 50S ribosomal protein L30 [Euryarchaeota archaeon]HIG03085.1 50S ribosomal protein L30 [Candidatus Poseidoniales archaeon]HIK78457.1 50S ribosomal protein L30 [Candidatus Poseidoniales archaeon]